MNFLGLIKKEKSNETEESKGKIYEIPVSQMIPGVTKRQKIEDCDISALADSIEKYGLLQPIIIRRRENVPYIEINGDRIYAEKYEIVAGERRWRAAGLLGLETVPCLFADADDRKAAEISLTENKQRIDIDFFEEAEIIQRLIREHGVSAKEIADLLSVSQTALVSKIRMLKLSEAERNAVKKGNLTEWHVRTLTNIDDGEKRFRLLEKIISTSMSAAEAERAADSVLKDDPEQGKRSAKKKIALISDIRFFINSIGRAVSILEDAGIKVDRNDRETDNFYEVTVKVSKKKPEL